MDNPIKTHIERKQTTQRAYAEQLGVREATLSAWMNGQQPSSKMIERMAKNGIPAAKWFRRARATQDTAA